MGEEGRVTKLYLHRRGVRGGWLSDFVYEFISGTYSARRNFAEAYAVVHLVFGVRCSKSGMGCLAFAAYALDSTADPKHFLLCSCVMPEGIGPMYTEYYFHLQSREKDGPYFDGGLGVWLTTTGFVLVLFRRLDRSP